MLADLSGAAAKVVLALIVLGNGTLTEIGDTAGIRRRATVRQAVEEARAEGLVHKVDTRRYVPRYTVSFPLSGSERSAAERHSQSGNGERDSLVLDYDLRVLRFPATDQTHEAAADLDSSDQAVIEGTESVRSREGTESVHSKVQKVYTRDGKVQKVYTPGREGTESVPSSVQKVYLPATATLEGEGTESVRSRSEYTESVLSPFEELEVADAMDPGDGRIGPSSPYVLRRRAQVAAVRAVWTELFPTRAPITDTSAGLLITAANHHAAFVGVVLQDMALKGEVILSPVAYAKKTIETKIREGNGPTILDDLDAPTPELLADLARAVKTGSQLWGRDDA